MTSKEESPRDYDRLLDHYHAQLHQTVLARAEIERLRAALTKIANLDTPAESTMKEAIAWCAMTATKAISFPYEEPLK